MNHRSRSTAAFVSAATLAACLASAGCGDKDKKEAPINPVSLPGNASPIDIGTKVGNGRVIELGNINLPTSTQWTRIYPLDKNRVVLAGHVEGEAFALMTTDRGVSWKAHAVKADGVVSWSVGVDGTLVASVAKRQIPAKAPPAGTLPPVDALSFHFAAPDQPKISTASALLGGDPEGKNKAPTVPRGTGMAAVLGPSLASVVVEIAPKSFAIAYDGGPNTEQRPGLIELPKGESPINAPFGHPPQLITTNGKQLLIRPWPNPGDKLAEPKPIEPVVLTKTTEDELSAGPECEWGQWSFKRIAQDKSTYLLGISPDKTIFLRLHPQIVNTDPIGCSADKIVFEFIDDEKIPRVATCSIDGNCVEPKNRPFKPWSEQNTRELHVAPSALGMLALQQMRTKTKWVVEVSESVDGGKNFNLPRPVGEGEGGNPEDGYDVAAIIPLVDRNLMILSAKVSKTTRRSWYAMASDDSGVTWVMP